MNVYLVFIYIKRARCFQQIPFSFLYFYLVLDCDLPDNQGHLQKEQNPREDKVNTEQTSNIFRCERTTQ